MIAGSKSNEAFAAIVGETGLVHAVGANRAETYGGTVDPLSTAVRAPTGIMSFEPQEMVVRVGASTLVGELDAALAEHGQRVDLGDDPLATVGGVLALGHSGIYQLGHGLVRDTLLATTYVTAQGQLLNAGAPVVKNVSGFDLCRLFVGSLGTLGLFSDVTMRTTPLPAHRQWLHANEPCDVASIDRCTTRPVSIVAAPSDTWICLEGHPDDLAVQQSKLADHGFQLTQQPPELPRGRRWCQLGKEVPARGEYGLVRTGVVLRDDDILPMLSGTSERLSVSLRDRFDPQRRLNRGRQPWVSSKESR